MSDEHHDAAEGAVEEPAIPHTVHELRAFQSVMAALIMPDRDGRRVAYPNGRNFVKLWRNTSSTLEEALAVAELLPLANHKEQNAKARDMEEFFWLQLQDKLHHFHPTGRGAMRICDEV